MTRLGDILDLEKADDALASREIRGIACDSRKVEPGDVFFALAGARDDGLKHVGEAAAKGAAVIVARREAPVAGAPFVRVPTPARRLRTLLRGSSHASPRRSSR